VAIGVALGAFLCYHATLLPGLDLGDSASFQTGVGSLTLTPRQAYPLYYGLGNVFAWLDPNEPAHAMNLASAVYGAVAVGLVTCVAAELAGSILGGIAAGLFLAFSYTFWTQAITAEVYTLHLLIIGGALLALLSWAHRPTRARLAVFYAIYALGFGNHLSMILLLPAFAVFMLMSRERGQTPFLARGSDPLHPKAIGLALAIAGLAALQYSWNFRGLWVDPEPPTSVGEAFAKFWFDVTKADWRETLVMGLSKSGLQNRPAFYWFDLRQQFGVPGAILAAAGFVYITLRRPRFGILVALLYAANLAFAWTYNVGDAYIFFLPSHYMVAICAGAGVAALMHSTSRVSNGAVAGALGATCVLYPMWRGYDTFPAVDRSTDNRAVQLLDELTAPFTPRGLELRSASGGIRLGPVGLLCDTAVFGLDANWQVQNAGEYYMRRHKPGVPWFITEELLWLESNPDGFSTFVGDNVQQGNRDVVITSETIRKFGMLKVPEPQTISERPAPALSDIVKGLPKGLAYVIGVLRPDNAFPMNDLWLSPLWSALTGGAETAVPTAAYTTMIGRIGERSSVMRADNRPYRVQVTLDQRRFDVRMESWLPTDTIRRSGFGHAIIDRSHALTLERGVSLLVIGQSGPPVLRAYRAGLFEPPRRFIARYANDMPAPCYR
jgi:hypothetical protein